MCDAPALIDMGRFVIKYLSPRIKIRVLDVGSIDVNGTYKTFFDHHDWEYTGLDVLPGPNVDVVTSDPYRYPFDDSAFDVIVSGQTLEHVEDTHKFMREVGRLVKPGGLVYISVPHDVPEHRFPIDCWRIFPDGMRFLFTKIANLTVLEIRKTSIHCVGIGRKPLNGEMTDG